MLAWARGYARGLGAGVLNQGNQTRRFNTEGLLRGAWAGDGIVERWIFVGLYQGLVLFCMML